MEAEKGSLSVCSATGAVRSGLNTDSTMLQQPLNQLLLPELSPGFWVGSSKASGQTELGQERGKSRKKGPEGKGSLLYAPKK